MIIPCTSRIGTCSRRGLKSKVTLLREHVSIGNSQASPNWHVKVPQPWSQGSSLGSDPFDECQSVRAVPPGTESPWDNLYIITLCRAEALCGTEDVFGTPCERGLRQNRPTARSSSWSGRLRWSCALHCRVRKARPPRSIPGNSLRTDARHREAARVQIVRRAFLFADLKKERRVYNPYMLVSIHYYLELASDCINKLTV